MNSPEPIQRGLRPWRAALQKINEILVWLKHSRLVAGYGITLIETGNGIIINAENADNESDGASTVQTQNHIIPAKITGRMGNGGGYFASFYENGLEFQPTQKNVYVFLPEAAFGTNVPIGTVVMVNPVITKKYDVKAETV